MLNVDNATFTFPSSPLLTQGGDVSPEMLCSGSDSNDDDNGNESSNETRLSRRRCRPDDDTSGMCECVHVRHVPLGATVEIILLDQGNWFHPSVVGRDSQSRDANFHYVRNEHSVYSDYSYSFSIPSRSSIGKGWPRSNVRGI